MEHLGEQKKESHLSFRRSMRFQEIDYAFQHRRHDRGNRVARVDRCRLAVRLLGKRSTG